jgi:ATP-dependent Lon protease
MDEKTVRDIINFYTREAVFRSLEKEIATVCRKAAKNLVTSSANSVKLLKKILKNISAQKGSDMTKPMRR